MIADVRIKSLVRHVDDRGYFMEVLRDDEDLLPVFGQFSIAMTYPGVIKAFHYNRFQDDYWFFPVGEAQVVLYDLRDNSETKGKTQVVYMGETNPVLVRIPLAWPTAIGCLAINPQSLPISLPVLTSGRTRMSTAFLE